MLRAVLDIGLGPVVAAREFAVPLPALMDHLADLYVIGFVDYIDQFDERHRAGYARQYFPAVDEINYETEAERAKRNNLHVVAQDGYNYDRSRRRGEGKDWNEDN